MTQRSYQSDYQDTYRMAGGRPLADSLGAIIRHAAQVRHRMQVHARERRMLAQLRRLDDHTLKDIGMVRSELISVSRDRTGERRRSNVGR